MAEAMTYTSLVSDIKTYAERTDSPFVTQVPRFIMLAENRLASEVRGLGVQRYVTGSLTTTTLAKPERWRETISFRIVTSTGNKFLQNRSPDYCRAFDSGTTGVPRFYSDYGYEHFLVVPSPNAVYPFELAYYERPEPLSETNQTNWFTQYAPQLLLYASLLEAQPFLKRPERIQEFQGLYDRAVQGIAQETNRQVNSDRAGTQRNGA